MSVLKIYEILDHFVNTLTANDKYSLHNSETFPQPIQMQLYNQWTIFSEIFPPFLKPISIFKHFEKRKMTLIGYVLSKIETAKNVVRQMSKKLSFRTPFNSQYVKGSQTLVKSASQKFCQISLSLWRKLT